MDSATSGPKPAWKYAQRGSATGGRYALEPDTIRVTGARVALIDELVRKLQARSGMTAEQARRRIYEWVLDGGVVGAAERVEAF